MTIQRDEQGRPCLTITVALPPASAHDGLALSAALSRLLDAPDGSDEQREASDRDQPAAERAQGTGRAGRLEKKWLYYCTYSQYSFAVPGLFP